MDILEAWTEDDRHERYWQIAMSGIEPQQVMGVYEALVKGYNKDVALDDMAAKIAAMRKNDGGL